MPGTELTCTGCLDTAEIPSTVEIPYGWARVSYLSKTGKIEAFHVCDTCVVAYTINELERMKELQ